MQLTGDIKHLDHKAMRFHNHGFQNFLLIYHYLVGIHHLKIHWFRKFAMICVWIFWSFDNWFSYYVLPCSISSVSSINLCSLFRFKFESCGDCVFVMSLCVEIFRDVDGAGCSCTSMLSLEAYKGGWKFPGDPLKIWSPSPSITDPLDINRFLRTVAMVSDIEMIRLLCPWWGRAPTDTETSGESAS